MRKIIVTSILLLLALLVTSSVQAQFTSGLQRPGEPVTVKAAVSAQPLLPGKSAEIAVELTVNRAYHVQSAFAPAPYIPAKVTVAAAPGITVGAIQAQRGTDIPSPPALGTGTLSVYQGKAYFLIPITAAPDAAAGERTLDISITTQACDDNTCLPPKTSHVQVKAKVGAAGDAVEELEPALFAAAHKQQFLPTQLPEPPASATQTQPAATKAGDVPLLNDAQQQALIESRPYQPFNTREQEYSLAAILGFALVGGLILNVMPCVLPVIPLKALSFVQHAHGNHRVAMLHSLAFSAGIVTLFVALALVLRTGGLFYGQQFQSPAFLITMALFVVALALSMLGVWTISTPQVVYKVEAKIAESTQPLDYSSGAAPQTPAARAYLASYGNGLMATLLATPCSAPFLGPVFAWAFNKPAWLTAMALAVVGVGMSIPYLVLAAFPKMLNRVPRAGRWSELLKQGLGIVMLGVGIYLITRIQNTRLWFWGFFGALAIALVCWGWGQIPSLTMSLRRIWTIRSIVLAIGILLGGGITYLASGATRPPDNHWVPFNVALLDKALKDGRPVVVDWTADWCINCQVLDATVLSREETQQAFAKSNALLLRADLTSDNPAATALNKKLGGEAIPVLAIFSPARPDKPVVLRDTYSRDRVIAEIEAAR
jgi:thiol:disulfide interchange protein DsbD